MDEMEYYLYMLECYKPGTMYGVLQLHDRPDQHTALTEYVLKVATEAGSDPEGSAKAFVIFTGDHWVPVVIRVQGIIIHLWTTPEDLKWMRPLIEATVGAKAFQFATSVMPSAFQADCGFQAVGWICQSCWMTQPMCPSQRNKQPSGEASSPLICRTQVQLRVLSRYRYS